MAEISFNSRRVAKNTLLLYLRMLLMMFIGLFTSRIVLQTLGVDDFGTYNAVYEMVMLFTVVSNSVSNAISRFMAFEMGRDDLQRQKKVFSSAMVIQTMMSALLLLVVCTLGLWYLRTHMVLPPNRADEALWVMMCSAGIMIVQLYSIPFNATIIAAEDMKAFAWISILEAALKLAVALLLTFSPADKLVAYAVMMLCVGLLIRATYAIYCRRHFQITKGAWEFDRSVIREMLGFSGWGMLGSGMNVVNTKGISLLANSFFGVGVNAARGISMQVENIVKQFVSNFLTALNPQITKSWSAGNREYCWQIVGKGCKFSYLLMLVFILPFAFEAEMILDLWLAEVPPYAASFTRLTLICMMMDMMANSLSQLVLSTGRVRSYFIASSSLMALVFAGSWIAFAAGYGPQSSYLIYIAVYMIVDAVKLFFAHRESGLQYCSFLKDVVLPCLEVSAIAILLCALPWYFLPAGWLRLILVLVLGTAGICAASYLLAFTPGEREFVREQISKIFRR